MLQAILLFFGSLVILGFVILLSLYIYGFQKSRHYSKEISTRHATIIIPCKGADRHLQQNLRAFCLQQYAPYHIIFVIDCLNDPAYPILQTLVKDTANTVIEITKPVSTTSGKIAALLTGVEQATDTDILVFADSDIRPHPYWLSSLIAPLSDPQIGATTGFRWFFPTTLKSYLLSVWNMGSLISQFHPLSNYTWGGSTAITKQLFDQLNICHHWRTGLSDDLILTNHLKKADKTICFLPKCIAESPVDTSVSSFLRWGSQQFMWIRWYNPLLWTVSLGCMLFLHLILFCGILTALYGSLLIAGVLLSHLFFEMLYGRIVFFSLRSQMQYPKKKFGSALPYIFFMPLIFLFFTFNLIQSAVVNKIEWHGKTYRKKGVIK